MNTTTTQKPLTIGEIAAYTDENYRARVLEVLTRWAEEGDLSAIVSENDTASPAVLDEARELFFEDAHRFVSARMHWNSAAQLAFEAALKTVDLSDTIAEAWRINKSAQEGEN